MSKENNELKSDKEISDYRSEVATGLWGDDYEGTEYREEPPDDPPDNESEIPAETDQDEGGHGHEEEPGNDDDPLKQVKDLLQGFEYRLKQAESRVGSIQNQIQNPRQQPKREEKPPAKKEPTAEELAASTQREERWKKLIEDFPEFEEVLTFVRGELDSTSKTGGIEAALAGQREELSTDFNQKLNAAQLAIEIKFLTRAHPDWRSIDGSPEFNEWLSKQTAEIQNTALNSEDAIEIIDVFDRFKDDQRKAKGKPPEDKGGGNEADKIVKDREERLSRSRLPHKREKSVKHKSEDQMTDAEYRQRVAENWDNL